MLPIYALGACFAVFVVAVVLEARRQADGSERFKRRRKKDWPFIGATLGLALVVLAVLVLWRPR